MGNLPTADAYLALMAADLATWRLDCVAEVAHLSSLWARWLGLTIPHESVTCSLPFAQWRTYVHPDDWPHVRAELIALLKGEIPRYFARYRIAVQGESTYRQWVWLEDRGQVTERDPVSSGSTIRWGMRQVMPCCAILPSFFIRPIARWTPWADWAARSLA